ncbi:MAG TPA: Flp pilus assembly protein CpaB [Negativicutes bacterium]|nr:Flp pilus assembly protein CpaB [Negativicutes bacterium]
MAKLSTKGLTAVALVFSLLAAVLVYSYLQNLAGQNKQGQPVVVAKTDIAPKTKMTAEMLKVVSVPPEYIQPGAVQDISKAVGVVVREQIAAGEQVTQRRLVIEGRTGGFTTIIPANKRAVTVAVTDVSGVGGLVKPGDYVDIIVTFDDKMVGENLSQIFLQNVRVLAINRDIEAASTGESAKKDMTAPATKLTVTLAVSPDDAARLAVADEKGKIRMALRPFITGDAVVASNPQRPRDIVTAPAPPAAAVQYSAPPAEPPTKGIQVIRGTEVMDASQAVPAKGRK